VQEKDPLTAAAEISGAKSAFALPERPSIAVLPFTNMSSDLEQDYFADGITDDIITALSYWRWLFVIARNSTFAYALRSVTAMRARTPVTMCPTCDHAPVRGMAEVPQ
jgi:TolB-like protein